MGELKGDLMSNTM